MEKLPKKIEDTCSYLKERFYRMSDFERLDIAIKLENYSSKDNLHEILQEYLDKISKTYFSSVDVGRKEFDA